MDNQWVIAHRVPINLFSCMIYIYKPWILQANKTIIDWFIYEYVPLLFRYCKISARFPLQRPGYSIWSPPVCRFVWGHAVPPWWSEYICSSDVKCMLNLSVDDMFKYIMIREKICTHYACFAVCFYSDRFCLFLLLTVTMIVYNLIFIYEYILLQYF